MLAGEFTNFDRIHGFLSGEQSKFGVLHLSTNLSLTALRDKANIAVSVCLLVVTQFPTLYVLISLSENIEIARNVFKKMHSYVFAKDYVYCIVHKTPSL